MVNLKTLLYQSVPNEKISSKSVAKTLGIAIGIIYFIFTFLEPFNFNVSNEYNKYLVFLGFVSVYFVTLFIALKWILPSISKLFGTKFLYFHHFILGYFFLIVLVTFVHNTLQNYLNNLPLFNSSEFLTIFPNAIFIGVIPTLIMSLISYTQALKKQASRNVKDLSGVLKQTKQEGHILIMSENTKNQYRFIASSIIYIKSEDNYINVVFKNEQNNIETELIRVPLKKVEAQLSRPFLRVHRSFLVNLNYTHKVSGNAQGMLLTMNTISERIPVSRSYVEAFKEALKSL